MKMKELVVALMLITFCSACSPRIGTMITKTYPALETDSPVEVYMLKQAVPKQSESLGVVSVGDTGFSTKCDSATVIGLIKEKARQSGGNAVLITEYVKPSFWGSSCHQMTATVLKVYDFLLPEDVEGTANFAGMEDVKVIKPDRKLPKVDMMANFGYGKRLASISTSLSSTQRDAMKDLMSGTIWDLSFKYYFSDIMGIGLDYSGYRATTDKIANDVVPTNDMMTYIGPSYLIRYSPDQKWIFDSLLGLGYLGYSSSADYMSVDQKVTGVTVGAKWDVGVSYKFSEHWGVGANLSLLSGVLNKVTLHENGRKMSVDLGDNEKEGLGQFRIGLGIRYYIK